MHCPGPERDPSSRASELSDATLLEKSGTDLQRFSH